MALTPFLMFTGHAEEAVHFYVSTFLCHQIGTRSPGDSRALNDRFDVSWQLSVGLA